MDIPTINNPPKAPKKHKPSILKKPDLRSEFRLFADKLKNCCCSSVYIREVDIDNYVIQLGVDIQYIFDSNVLESINKIRKLVSHFPVVMDIEYNDYTGNDSWYNYLIEPIQDLNWVNRFLSVSDIAVEPETEDQLVKQLNALKAAEEAGFPYPKDTEIRVLENKQYF